MNFDYQTIWFILVGVLFMGYAILDGFDLGIGALHLFVKEDRDRRLFLNAIGPIWDGNEVWLVTGGGALFAAFPEVYATVFSGFYLAFMLLLVALIFRAVAIEFRSKQSMAWWRQLWDVSFSISSIVSSLLVGIAMGNIAWGIPLAADHDAAADGLDAVDDGQVDGSGAGQVGRDAGPGASNDPARSGPARRGRPPARPACLGAGLCPGR